MQNTNVSTGGKKLQVAGAYDDGDDDGDDDDDGDNDDGDGDGDDDGGHGGTHLNGRPYSLLLIK